MTANGLLRTVGVYTWRELFGHGLYLEVALDLFCAHLVIVYALWQLVKCVLGKSCCVIFYSLRQLFGDDILAKVYNWRELIGHSIFLERV